ncbi:uL15m family ribosomal protein [Halobacterium zhouii]|uniref:uL15m family ribosomal protein n=1 Tax=Halobacterium zhouii TaxID=2902624 RepID=UPI001E28F5F4|nr:uL15m family ribosomal protein [Halobacterium zhouii]
MTDKKRRQRGSRTHGGGSHKNRRGAGNRGGRGRAGRKKHEFHNYESVGKSGFKRPEKTQVDVREVPVQKLDEDVALLIEDGVAEETDDGYRVDARDVAEDGWDADVVKVLGGGQVHERFEVTADAFTDGAVELIESEGGDAVVSDRAESEDDEADADDEE